MIHWLEENQKINTFLKTPLVRFEPTTYRLQVQYPNHYTSQNSDVGVLLNL